MGDRIVGDECLVESDGLAIEEVGKGLIGGRGIAKRAGREIDGAIEVFVQLAFHTETGADAGTVAVLRAFLGKVLATNTDIASEAEAPQNILQRTDPFFLFF